MRWKIATAVALFILLSPGVVGLSIIHEPVSKAYTGEPILINVRIQSIKSVEKVEIVPSWNYEWRAFKLNLTTGTNTDGLWTGAIPPTDKIGTLFYQIDIRFEDGTNKVEEYHVDIYPLDEKKWLDLPENPWVVAIGALFIIGAMVILEIILKNRFFKGKKENIGKKRRAKKVKKN